jgi:hypothetical protein
LSKPILIGSSASDLTINGLAICIAPIVKPARSVVRRLTGAITTSLDIPFLPWTCRRELLQTWPANASLNSGWPRHHILALADPAALTQGLHDGDPN